MLKNKNLESIKVLPTLTYKGEMIRFSPTKGIYKKHIMLRFKKARAYLTYNNFAN